MERVHELALQAAYVAGGLLAGDVESFRWQGTPDTGVYNVILQLTDGSSREYTIIERRKKAETSSGVSP